MPGADSYHVERELGRGGMGVVYLARDVETGERVALKRLSGGGDRAELEREFEMALRLRHPVIVEIRDFGSDDHGPFLVMEYIDGDDLLSWAGKVDGRRVARWAVALADALEYARRRGLVHGDIKPHNVLVPRADPDRARLLDLGLVGRSGTSSRGGTPAYMAPEVLAGKPPDHRADLFSLGCVLYQCLTGVPPFDGADRRTPPPLPDDVPAALAAVVERLLRPLPNDRPGRSADLLVLLGEDAGRRLPLPEGDLVGREKALELVRQGRVLLLEAAPGMGATRLLRELVERAAVSRDPPPVVHDVGDAAAVASAGDRAVVIAHRPSALSAVDLVLMMIEGRVQAFGPKDEVLAKVVRSQPTAAPPLRVVQEQGSAIR